jgi:hypothetical protein
VEEQKQGNNDETKEGKRMKKPLVGALLALAMCGTATAGVLTIVDNIGGTWIDISGTGLALNLSDDGEVNFTTSIGNSVFAAGTIRIGSNGAVRFDGGGLSLSFTNYTIPSNNMFSGDQSLAVFWDDINTANGTRGNIYVEDVGDTLVIQWQDVDFFGGGVDTTTFQIQVHTSGPGLAQFLYRDVEDARADGGGSATIGYQDGSAGFNDFQWSYNTRGAVSNGTVLTLVPAPGAMALLGLGGLLARRRRRR